jgi:PAS domain S-box-containing protein
MIFENSIGAVWISDKHGLGIRVNAAYESLSGMPREKLLGRKATELVGNVVSAICTEKVLETRKTVAIQQDYYLTGKSAIVTATPVLDKNGEIAMVICNDHDINVLQKLKEQLSQAQELVIHHEMKVEALKRRQLYGQQDIIAEDPRSKEVLERVRKVAQVDTTVLLLGETGVGKEEIAKLIHQNSKRRNEAFVKINCGAISPELVESELFGYEKGSFTGANSKGKLGLFEIADNGTVFLDEIGELPLNMQVKLLRVLQEQEITRVGGTKSIKINIRIIAATNRNLKAMVQHKLFREDLYYRINVFPLHMLPLRERPDDILPLANLFLKQLNDRYNCQKKFTTDAQQKLRQYEWTGNVRELRNCVEQAFIIVEDDTIQLRDLRSDLPQEIQNDFPFIRGQNESLEDFLRRIEYRYIQDAYEKCGNVRAAAKLPPTKVGGLAHKCAPAESRNKGLIPLKDLLLKQAES